MDRRKFILSSVSVLGVVPLAKFGRANAASSPIRFGIITDMHYAERPPNIHRYYRQSLGKTAECVQLMNEQKVDFLVEIGDLKDEGTNPNETQTLGFLDRIEAELQRFKGPLYHVLGNHDADSISKQQFLAHIRNHGFSEARNYYAFDQGAFHFVVLDANYTAKGIAYDHGNFDWKDAYIPQEQLTWLTEDLKNNKKPTIVFVHQQLDSSAFEDAHKVYCPANADEVRSILEKSGKVLVVFQGHYHPGSFHKINGIYYYTLRGVIEGDGPQNNSYAIVEVGSDRVIRIKGYRKAESQVLGQ